MSTKKLVVIFVLLFLLMSFLNAQGVNQVNIIFDASGSMWGQIDGVSKIQIARNAMVDLMKDFELQKDLQLALRIYGHTNKQCDNSILEIPMGTGNHSAIIDKIKSIKPLGKTPIAYSLEQCVSDFKNVDGGKTIVLITDGLESCNGDICEVAQALKDAGIITNIHIVGFGLKEDAMEALACIVKPFGGKILGAGNAGELVAAFQKIVKATVSYNMEIRAKDDNGKDIYTGFEVYNEVGAVVAKGDNSLDNVCKLSLKSGTYKIIAKNNQTSDKIEVDNVVVTDDKLTKKEVIFAERIVKISIVNGNNEFLDGSVRIYNSLGKKVGIGDNSIKNPITLKVIPGIYKIQVSSSTTNMEKIIENVDLIDNKEYEQNIVFSISEIEIKLVNSAGEGLYGDIYIFDKSGKRIKHGDTSLNPARFEVPSNIYDIKIIEYETKKEVLLENIDLTKMNNYKKEVVID